MDYEKLHKDTITKLQEMVTSGKITTETACNICADFVPESEDERIRKELKFKVGDWVVYCGKFCKITGLQNGIFTITNQDGSYFFNRVESTTEPAFHLWAIQDAKEGDVLSWDYGRYTILFKELRDNKIIAHCSYNNNSEHFGTKGNYDTTFNSDFKFIPGTKNQRVLLFKKIKEAGYVWDAEKKELRNV